ncbi:hypothetical protein [Acinetobacter sp. TSRC1-2]|uniref:hypothetical protein n=1 Tax=unclassified Acinetobacter TaxID=196816 RepID=UPI003CFA8549
MANLSNKIKELTYTFDEMISAWSANGYYRKSNVEKGLITDLEVLKQIELFFLDIDSLKTLLFVPRGRYVRNTYKEMGTLHHPTEVYAPSVYAKKWFPFQHIFKMHICRSEITEYKFLEISNRFEYFYHDFNLSIATWQRAKGNILKKYAGSDDYEIKQRIFIFESYHELLPKLISIDNVPSELARFINGRVGAYRKAKEEGSKTRNIDASFSKKKKEYSLYVKKLLEENGSLFAVSINFYFSNGSSQLDHRLIKKKFLNSLRSLSDLSMVVGYLGTWEFSRAKEYYLRIVFFIPKKQMYKAEIFEEVIINYWNNFQYKHEGKMVNPPLDAEVSNLSYSHDRLKKSHCVIPNYQSSIFENFVDTVINYTVLAEKFFFPYELQMFLYSYSKEGKHTANEDGYYIIDNLKYTFSRSFRGHIRKN